MKLRHKNILALCAFLACAFSTHAQADTINFTYTISGNLNLALEGPVLSWTFTQISTPNSPLGAVTYTNRGIGFDTSKPNPDGTISGMTINIYTIGGDRFLSNGPKFLLPRNAQGITAFFGSTTITSGTGLFAGATGRTIYTGTFNSVTNVSTITETVTLSAPGVRAPACTPRTVSGTYGYRLSGVVTGSGGGPFLVNGLFTHNPDGTMSANASATINGQPLPAAPESGTFEVNSDCTGVGEFFNPVLNQKITYKFIATEGGNQLELLNTNEGIVLHGVGRRISEAGRAPSCNSNTVVGNYGYRIAGSLPGVPHLAGAGLVTKTADGELHGKEGVVFNGAPVVRRGLEGTFTINSNCTGKGVYKDTLGNTVNFVFVAVDGGAETYFLGTDPGGNVSGVTKRQ